MYLLAIFFFVTAILYSSVGFGGGSTYLALLLIWNVPYLFLEACWKFLESSRSNKRRVSPSPLLLHWSNVFKPTLTLEYLFFSHDFWHVGSWNVSVDSLTISEVRGRTERRITGAKADNNEGSTFGSSYHSCAILSLNYP